MTIMESAIAMNNDYIESSVMLGKVNLFAEACYKDYEINLKKAALKVLKESGTEDDFEFLATEAGNAYIEKAKKSIEKIIESVKKFVKQCKEKVMSLIQGENTKKAIDKAEMACKTNPKICGIKVKYQNTDKQVGIIQQGIDSVRKKAVKLKVGKGSEKDSEELDKIDTDTAKKVAAISTVAVVTLGAAIALYKKTSKEIEGISLDCCDDISSLGKEVKPGTPAEEARSFVKASGIMAKLKKEKAAKKAVKLTSIVSGIKSALSEAKGKVRSENLETESADDITSLKMFEVMVTESTDNEMNTSNFDEEATVTEESAGTVEGLDLDQYYEELCNELFTEPDATTVVEEAQEEPESVTEENTEETDDSYTETYMEQLEHELFGEDESMVQENEELTTESASDKILEDVESFLNEMEDLLE